MTEVIPKTLPYQVPELKLTRGDAKDVEALYKAVQNWSKDLTNFVRRISASINLANRGAFDPSNLVGNGFTSVHGLYLQWGSATASAAGVTVNFPAAFPHACFAVILQLQGTTPGPTLSVQILSSTQFKAFSSIAGPVAVSFLAVGN